MRRILATALAASIGLMAGGTAAPLEAQDPALVEAGLIAAGDWEQDYDDLQIATEQGRDSYESLLSVRSRFLEVAQGVEGGDQIMGPNLTVPNQLPAGAATGRRFRRM